MENRRKSRIKRLRTQGFRTRMRTSKGRQMISRKRHVGRSVNIREDF